MEQLDSINFLYSLCGLVVGVLVGMTGIGGGSLMTPLLILFFGVHPGTAVGTDLLYASATKTVGTGVHSISRSVDWQIVSFLAAGSMPATVMTIYGLTLLGPASHEAGALITGVLGAALFLTAASLLFRGSILRAYADRIDELGTERTRWPRPGPVSCGACWWRSPRSAPGPRCDCPPAAVSASADGPHRWFGHRPCGAVNLGRRHRPLVIGSVD